jgi:3-oxoacyl-[acyl-carrier protein] reductase
MGFCEGKVAFVTGGSRGIGRAISRRLAEQGARVGVGCSSATPDAQQFALEIGGFLVAADLAQAPAAEECAGYFSELDILVNNAGILRVQSFEETSPADLTALLQVNVQAPFFLTQALLPKLREGGRIVNVSSITGSRAFPATLAYGMTKAALENFTRSLAAHVGARGICVNAIAPGPTQTEMTDYLREPSGRDWALSQQALQRVAQPDDVAGAVEFLVSPSARWITGQVLHVNGGWSL